MDGYAYIDRARDGESNMAIDRRLLEAAEQQRCVILRLYRWAEPTLSLGHFQRDINRAVHPPSAGIAQVVRASGGGAIVHDQEWTYSIAAPLSRQQVGAAPHLYDLVHDAIVRGLRGLGWDARKWTSECVAAGSPEQKRGAQPAFLCFQRRSCGDIVCGAHKIVGSAQRRLGSSVLQHGSILCASSLHAPELPGLSDLSSEGSIFAHEGTLELSRQISKKAELESENFAGDVISWIASELFGSLGVSPDKVGSKPAFIDDVTI